MVLLNNRLSSPADLESTREQLLSQHKPSAKSIHVCTGPGCAAKGSPKLYELF